MVEDNKADVFLIREAIESALDAEIQVLYDGDKAIRFFDQINCDGSAPCPDLVILDINLPKKHGGHVLSHIRKSRCAGALVLVVTSSNSAEDREEMERQGADAYFRKPSDYEEFMQLGEIVKELLGGMPAPS